MYTNVAFLTNGHTEPLDTWLAVDTIISPKRTKRRLTSECSYSSLRVHLTSRFGPFHETGCSNLRGYRSASPASNRGVFKRPLPPCPKHGEIQPQNDWTGIHGPYHTRILF